MKMKKPKKSYSIFIYYGIVVGILLLVNLVLYPYLLKQSVTEVGYSDMLEKIEAGVVKKVEKQSNQWLFVAEEDGKEVIYKTGPWDDPGLTKLLHEKNIDFGSKIQEEPGLFVSVLSWFLPIIIIIVGGRILSRSLAKSMGGVGPMSFGKSNAKVYVEANTGKSFKDVAGQEEAKEALSEIVSFLHNPAKYARIGAKLPKGALLVGPPGTGKTLLAQAVAGEAHVPFFSISGSEFVEMFVGMGASRVRDLFKQANEKAPCIVFIDEIDTIGKRRDSQLGGNDEREQTLNQLLAEMDGFDGKKGVVILAATNRPEILDPALLRPGRFDRRIPVELPDLKGRIDILKVHIRNVRHEDNINFEQIGLATAGASGADLANMINEAALRAVREGRTEVTQRDIVESVEVVIAGYERKSMVISPAEKRIIAYHEVGHALVAASQTHSAPVAKITIIPRTSGALGYTLQIDKEEKFLMSKEELYNQMVTLSGGRAAEEVIFNTQTTGASNDIEKITNIANAIVMRYGMTDRFGMATLVQDSNIYLGGGSQVIVSEGTHKEADEVVLDLIKSAHEKAVDILKRNEEALHDIANHLIEKETITGDEFMEIFNRHVSPEDKIEAPESEVEIVKNIEEDK
ncbi:MAG: ATP-dependent zinc metalloprotease FtsH [Ezakiella sp.]|uniref:ATP-dependent zinc metalloprotease FtsH n=1 Tax=Ezakiella sp. TaxID=1935205 RepID=UPI002974ECB8|nr:ATP-dependent zinc metalloprotease FtsH [Ezakiella sp.]MDD7731816.1 ATP-dependent zinc metalloprotease FtsH [Eubacteriales bacterium]MDY6079258.1 ATP-dependent zinc metalloprotease FtsH [Ezakiella sp.]